MKMLSPVVLTTDVKFKLKNSVKLFLILKHEEVLSMARFVRGVGGGGG